MAVYIRAQLIACLLIGTVCTIGFSLIGVRYALVLGIVSGLLEFIPLIGPLVVALIATLIASVYSMTQALGVVVFLGILRIVHDYVVYPRIMVVARLLWKSEMAHSSGLLGLANPQPAAGHGGHRRNAPWRAYQDGGAAA